MSPADSLARTHHGGHSHAAAAIAGCSPDDILDFSASLNPLGPPAAVLAAMSEASEAVRKYPDPHSTELRMAIAQHYALDPDWILPGNGAAELFTWIARSSSQLGTTGLFVPAFGDYARALKTASAPFIAVTMADEFGNLAPDRAFDLLDRLRPARPDVLWINNPHNPSGHLWKRSQLLELLPQFQLVVVDEAFMDFLPGEGESLLSVVADWPQLVVVRSLTKFYAIAGLRVGFVVAHPERLACWQKWRDPWSVNGLASVGAIAALSDREFQQRTFAWLPAARQGLISGLRALGCHPRASAANFLLARAPVSVAALQYDLVCCDRTLIRTCHSFARDGHWRGEGDRWFRIAVRTQDENQRLLESLPRSLSRLQQVGLAEAE